MNIETFVLGGEFSDIDKNHRLLPLYHTSQCFEKKVRRELEAIGFLDPANENNQVRLLSWFQILISTTFHIFEFHFQKNFKSY